MRMLCIMVSFHGKGGSRHGSDEIYPNESGHPGVGFHLPQERIRSALRISFSYETDEEQLRIFAAALREVIDRLMKVVKTN